MLLGSIRDDRVELIEALKKDGVNAELIGGVFREEYIDALASAKIVVNQNPPQGKGLLNMRHFEAQAAGSFLLEQWNDARINIMNGGMYNSFGFMQYQVNELAETCKEFLAECDSEASLDALRKSQDDFFAHHTYQNRCQEILDTVFPNG